MVDGGADAGDGDHIPLRGLLGLVDGGGDLVGFCVAVSDPSVAVTDHDERTEAEPASTLDRRCGAVDSDRVVFEVRAFFDHLGHGVVSG